MKEAIGYHHDERYGQDEKQEPFQGIDSPAK
jgi:hypothetical protein